MDEIEIRKMKKEDINDVCELVNQLNDVFQTKHNISITAISNTYNEMEDKNTFYINYIAQRQGTIVGFISSIIYKTFFHPRGTLLINELVVDKNHRGKRIGEKLLGKVFDIATDIQLNEIEVGTTFENQEAIKFYKKNGLADESIILGKELNI